MENETQRTTFRIGRILEVGLGLFLVGVLALVGGPRFRRTLQASASAQAVADTRAVLSAENTYASVNFGFFDDLARLCQSGGDCEGIGMSNYPSDGPDFLDPQLARPSPYSKNGYTREWIGLWRPESLPKWASETSVIDYCYRSTATEWSHYGAPSRIGIAVGVIYMADSEDPCLPVRTAPGEAFPCPMPAPFPHCWE